MQNTTDTQLSKAQNSINVNNFYIHLIKITNKINLIISNYNSNGFFNLEVKKLILRNEKILLLKMKFPVYYKSYQTSKQTGSKFREK